MMKKILGLLLFIVAVSNVGCGGAGQTKALNVFAPYSGSDAKVVFHVSCLVKGKWQSFGESEKMSLNKCKTSSIKQQMEKKYPTGSCTCSGPISLNEK